MMDSNKKGHFEEFSEEKLVEYVGKQYVVPEYLPVKKVLVSYSVVDWLHKKPELILEIFKSKVSEVIIAVPENFSDEGIQASGFKDLRELLGSDVEKVRLLRSKINEKNSAWARDWAPLGAVNAEKKLVLLDFNYWPSRPNDDIIPQSMGEILDAERVSIPVYNDGGNFINNESMHCMMTDAVVEKNLKQHFSSDKVLGVSEVKDYFKKYAGCKQVTIFPSMPYEATGHIDIWAKFVDDRTVLVNEIKTKSLVYVEDALHLEKVKEVQKFLDKRANDLERLGFKVVRLIMPLPELKGDSRLFRSYVNSLILNGRVIVPQFKMRIGNRKYTDDDLILEYEMKVKEVYQDLGLKVAFVNSDSFTMQAGAIHCVTMQFPDLEKL